MYSQCPECMTRFRVTAEVLRAAHGTVRCGRCGIAFDALQRLSDSIPPAASDEYRFTAEDIDRVFVEAQRWPVRPAVQDVATDAPVVDAVDEADGAPAVVVDERHATEDITLEGERIGIDEPASVDRTGDLESTDEFEILRHVPDSAFPEEEDETQRNLYVLVRQLTGQPVVQDAAVPPAAEVVEPPVSAEAADDVTELKLPDAEEAALEATPVATDERAGAAEPVVAIEPPAAAEEPLPLSARRWRPADVEPEPEPSAPAASAWGTLAWTLLGLVLALALAAQLVHYFRQDLVRHPQFGPPVRALYERFGLELSPNWDLGAFELRQWGNDADAGAAGRMAVRASLTNRASFPQPHPILRLELEDRFGNTVATRDFEPADYLKIPSQASRMIAPGASSEAELLLAATSRDAVGYRLDVCLRESATLLRCASGPG